MIRSQCTSCSAGIVWALHVSTGRRMPIDAEPVPGGNLRIVTEGTDQLPPVVAVVPKGSAVDMFDPTDDGTRYVSHFATCPNAAEHRRTT